MGGRTCLLKEKRKSGCRKGWIGELGGSIEREEAKAGEKTNVEGKNLVGMANQTGVRPEKRGTKSEGGEGGKEVLIRWEGIPHKSMSKKNGPRA